MRSIHILHDDDTGIAPLRRALGRLGIPYQTHHLATALIDLGTPPAEGIFLTRIGATVAPQAAAHHEWLAAHDATTLNGGRAVQLEASRLAQHQALARAGLPVARCMAARGAAALRDAGRALGFPLSLSEDRPGTSARGIADAASLARIDPGPGLWVLQPAPRAPSLRTRLDYIGGRFLYASRGAALDGFTHPLMPRLEAFLRVNALAVAALDLLTDADGASLIEGITTRTTYDPATEAEAGIAGLEVLTGLLTRMLAQQSAGLREAA